MLKTVSQFKDSVAALLSGMDLSNVDNLNGALERAARVLVQKADIPEASGVQNIVLYSGVFDYLCDSRIFGTAITDIRPQGVSRVPSDFVYKRPGEQFDRTKGWFPSGTMATFEYVNGVPVIRIKSTIPPQEVVLDQMNATTGWTAAGSASALAQDTAVYYQTPASLRFLLTGSSTGTLTKTLTNPLDLSSYENVGVAFLAIRIPDGSTASSLTSIDLRLGSDGSNYDSVSETEGFLGAWVAGDWLLVAFDFAGATSTGTPNWAALDYIQIRLAHTSTFTNFRVGGLFICQPSPAQILYQSAAIFLADSSTTALTTITANTDSIILNDPAFTLYEYEGALSVLQQTGGGAGDSMTARLKEELDGNGSTTFGLYGKFRGDNPSQELRQVGNYYEDGGDYGSR